MHKLMTMVGLLVSVPVYAHEATQLNALQHVILHLAGMATFTHVIAACLLGFGLYRLYRYFFTH